MKKYKRDNKGKFSKDLTLYKWLLVVFGIYAVSFIGVNTLWHWVKGFDRIFIVQNTVANETVNLRSQVEKMLRDEGIDVVKAMKIADYESWFRPDNEHWNSNGILDRGLWMINNKYHAEVSDECAYDGICSTKQAIRIMKSRGFNEWTCYKKNLCKN